jgi:hypothetical protein
MPVAGAVLDGSHGGKGAGEAVPEPANRSADERNPAQLARFAIPARAAEEV